MQRGLIPAIPEHGVRGVNVRLPPEGNFVVGLSEEHSYLRFNGWPILFYGDHFTRSIVHLKGCEHCTMS